MTLLSIDKNGAAALAASEAQMALVVGDTPRAREKYEEAGALLERNIRTTSNQSTKQLLRFLAATQYFKCGLYKRALELCRKINDGLLPKDAKPLYPTFLRDVKRRSSPQYEKGIRRRLLELFTSHRAKECLELLTDHPYIFHPGALAYLRAVMCEELGNFRAAALFFATALKYGAEDPSLIIIMSALPLTLPKQGRLAEAWDYVHWQVEYYPHAITYVSASIVAFHRALAASGRERRTLLEEQLGYFEKANQAYETLSDAQKNIPDFRGYLSFGTVAAGIALLGLGQLTRAKDICDRALQSGLNTSTIWAIRGIATFPSEQSLADLRKAAAMNDPNFQTYYHLALDAIQRGDPRAGLSWSQEALKRKTIRPIEAQLRGWVAICRDGMGASREEVEGLFRKALEIDPENCELNNNYRLFRDATSPSKPKRYPQPDPEWSKEHVARDLYVPEHELPFPKGFDRLSPLQRELQEAGV